MLKNSVLFAPQVNLNDFRNLFIELTTTTCNLKCKHCFIDQNKKKEKEFISIDIIQQALKDLENENIEMIYLTGAEPMLHPDFNAILRLCLKHCAVTICTNAMCINEKKARFLNKVENEGDNQLFFRISIDHYDERKNDDIRGRGAYRKAMHAISALMKYEFYPFISVTNYYDLPADELISGFISASQKLDFEIEKENIIITPYFDLQKSFDVLDVVNGDYSALDCAKSRTLNKHGIYTCPFLTSDHRGRMGATFKDFSRKNFLESDLCMQCQKHGQSVFLN